MASGKSRKRKKAAATAAPANAELKRLRGRLEFEVDAAVKRALRAEISKLEKVEKDANLSYKTKDGKLLRPPARVYSVRTDGYHGGKYLKGTHLIVRELVSVRKVDNNGMYGQPRISAMARAPGSSGASELSSSYGEYWWSTKALAIKAALADADDEIKEAREELTEREQTRAAIAAIATQPESAPAEKKHLSPDALEHRRKMRAARRKQPESGRVAAANPLNAWTPDEDVVLREAAEKGMAIESVMMALPERTREGIRKRAGRLHLKFAPSKDHVHIQTPPPPKPQPEALNRIVETAAEEAEPIVAGAVFANRTFPAQKVRVRDLAGDQVLYVHLTQDGRAGDPGLDDEETFRREYVAAEEPVEV